MNCIEWCKEFFYKHPATALGLLFGVLLGLSFAAFGFWRTFVVALCVAAGFILALRWMPARGLIFRLLRTVGIIDRKNKEDRFFDQA